MRIIDKTTNKEHNYKVLLNAVINFIQAVCLNAFICLLNAQIDVASFEDVVHYPLLGLLSQSCGYWFLDLQLAAFNGPVRAEYCTQQLGSSSRRDSGPPLLADVPQPIWPSYLFISGLHVSLLRPTHMDTQDSSQGNKAKGRWQLNLLYNHIFCSLSYDIMCSVIKLWVYLTH